MRMATISIEKILSINSGRMQLGFGKKFMFYKGENADNKTRHLPDGLIKKFAAYPTVSVFRLIANGIEKGT